MARVPTKYFLYAEDDLDDQQILREIVADAHPDIQLIICGHGLELIQFLEALGPDDALPCCIVLDMNMPLLDGIKTLKVLKSHPRFAALTVVMFTTSSAIRDAEHSKKLGAATFLTKPVTKADFQQVTREFSLFCQDEDTVAV